MNDSRHKIFPKTKAFMLAVVLLCERYNYASKRTMQVFDVCNSILPGAIDTCEDTAGTIALNCVDWLMTRKGTMPPILNSATIDLEEGI